MKRSLKNIASVYFILIGLLSCDSDNGFTKYKSLSNEGLSEKPIIFVIPDKVIDGGLKNLFIRLRNDNTYPYSNIFLIASIIAGEELITQDTLEYAMANPDGSWIGQGFTQVKESKLWWKEKIIFPKTRPISISISQAVRNNGKANGVSSLKGIVSVGLSIED